ncbi:DEAD-box ATP-dependent RNA helicase 38 [Tanacetum coccineum]
MHLARHKNVEKYGGFKVDSVEIMKEIVKGNNSCQVLLFSATFNDVVKAFVTKIVKELFVNKEYNQLFVKKEELSLDSVKQYKVSVPDELSKIKVIKDKIMDLGQKVGQTIMFVRTRKSAGMLHEALVQYGYEVTTIQGALSQEDRDKIVKEFKNGLTHVLISTDVLARGFDQSQVNLVVNYDLPVAYDNPTQPDNEVYLHRIGRAGRFGRKDVTVLINNGLAANTVCSRGKYFLAPVTVLTGAVFNLLCGERDEKIIEKIERHFNHYVAEVPSWESNEDFEDALKKAGLIGSYRIHFVQKGNNKHKKQQPQLVARVPNQGKGKHKLAYAPKPKIPPPPKREDHTKDSIYHECGETGHWKRNCPQHLAELLKKKKNAASGVGGSGIFTIELNTFLNRSWIYDTGCGTHICNTTQDLRASRKLKPGALSFKKRIEKLQHDGLLNSTDLRAFEKCVPCMSGKMARKPYTHQVERAKDLLGLIHIDVAFCLLEDLTAFCFKTSLRFASRPHCVLLQDLTAFCFKTSLRFASSYHCVLLQHHCVLLKTSIAFCLKTILRFDKKLLWQNFIHHCVLLQAITAFCFNITGFAIRFHCVLLGKETILRFDKKLLWQNFIHHCVLSRLLHCVLPKCSMPPNIVLQGFQRFLQAQWNHKSLKHKEIWDKRKMLWLVGTHKKEDRRISVVDELSGSRCFQDRFVTAVKLNKVLIFIPLHQQTPQSTIISTTPETSQLTPDTNQTDELLDNLTKQMAAPCPNPLEQRFVPQYQQSTYRTSSKHPGIKHSISDGRVVVRMFKGDRIRIRGQGNALKCYNCNGSLHILQGTVLSQAVHKILLFQGQDAFTDAKPKENRYGIINQFQDLALNGG